MFLVEDNLTLLLRALETMDLYDIGLKLSLEKIFNTTVSTPLQCNSLICWKVYL